MIDGAHRHDALALEAAIGRQQLAEIGEGVGDMGEAPAVVRRLLQAGDLHEGDAVMLIVVGDEGDVLVLEHQAGVEHGHVPLLQRLAVGGAQHEVREQRRRDRLAVERTADFVGERVHGGLR